MNGTHVPSRARLDLLDPLEVSKLGGLELITEGVVEGFLSGLHRSPRRGFSVEFAEHRMYQPGDELRYVDWKILGRNDRLYVKQYEEETNPGRWSFSILAGRWLGPGPPRWCSPSSNTRGG
jgi:uncharacterized protein (DUF58 family)